MRKILCFVLTLVACVLLTTAVSAETTVPTTCEACGGVEVEWVALTSSTKWYNLDEGHYHYYLTGNDTTYRYTPKPGGTVSSTNSGNAVTICLDLNGYGISTKGRAIGVYGGCTLNIMDSSEAQTGYIEGGHGTNNLVGGTFFMYGTMNLYQGTLRYSNDSTLENKCYAGAVISMGSSYADATFNMYGGKLEGGDLIAVSGKSCHGGTIFAEKGNINIYDGEITAGSVQEGYYGPCIYAGGSVKLTLSGDANVDNIYVGGSSAKLNIDGTYSGKARLTYADSIALSNGKVIGTGTNTPSITGDLYCTNGWLVNVDGSDVKLATYTPSAEWHYCEHCQDVRRWTAMTSSNYAVPKSTPGEYHYYLTEETSYYFQLCSGAEVCLDLYGNKIGRAGRALLPNKGSTLNLMDTVGGGTVHSTGGTDNPRGNCITVSGGAVCNMYSGTVQFTDTTDATNRYGVIAVGGTFNLYGGTVQGADLTTHTSSHGGAIYMYNSTSVVNLCGGSVTSGQVGGIAPCVEVNTAGQSVTLSGNAQVGNIYFTNENDDLTVSGTYTGTASVTFASEVALGDVIGVSDNATITGRIECTNGDWLVGVEGETLVITIDAPVVVVDGETETAYETLQAAINGYESGYLQLLQPITEDVTVDKDIVLDMNGQSITGTVTVSQGATLYGKDGKTDDYTVADGVYGTLSVSGSVAAQDGYLKINEDGAISFHKITVHINAMTLRPEKAGLYYKSTFQGDEKVADAVESFGVALSVREVPDESNLESACKYTTFTGFESGAAGNASTSTSTLLSGVLKERNSIGINRRNMNTEVYGRPYIKTADGYIFGKSVSRSLVEQLQGVDAQVDTLTDVQRTGLLTMYQTYQEALSTVSLPNIVNSNQTLRILMVGNSFCYYYVEELYGLLTANPDENRGYTDVEVYNLYYSGCRLNQHYDWWVAGTAKYDLYKTDKNGRVKQTPSTGTVWTLEEALQQGKWNYISLQGMSNEVSYTDPDSVEANCAAIVQYAEPLLDRFHELHPNAQLLWHRTWAFEVGRISGSTTYTEESLEAYDTGMQAACDYMCNVFDQDQPYDLMMVNSGKAWPIARTANAALETSLIPEGGLCARKGVRNENTFPYYTGNADAGDGYHDGDIGGGQFLNACAWYETLTGQSVLDNDYKPTTDNGKYELSDEFADLLRNAAHTAINPTEE